MKPLLFLILERSWFSRAASRTISELVSKLVYVLLADWLWVTLELVKFLLWGIDILKVICKAFKCLSRRFKLLKRALKELSLQMGWNKKFLKINQWRKPVICDCTCTVLLTSPHGSTAGCIFTCYKLKIFYMSLVLCCYICNDCLEKLRNTLSISQYTARWRKRKRNCTWSKANFLPFLNRRMKRLSFSYNSIFLGAVATLK